MADIPPAYTRANGEMLHNLRQKHACVLGKLGKVATNKNSFELTTSDHKTITVKLKTNLRDELTPFVEVYGIADDHGNIDCINYTTFMPALYENFDMDLYNETLIIASKMQNHYHQH